MFWDVRADILEECIISIIRVDRIRKLGTALIVTISRCTLQRDTNYMRKKAIEWDR
jgi:hypothetical protein